ncbi:hypothetical protein S7335_911 [Synechococcus sp. PCC 7335]|nr:hypothetical protein S7335_911 [Synechococcus sp. PCC 7335]
MGWAFPFGSGYPLPIEQAIQPGSLSGWCFSASLRTPRRQAQLRLQNRAQFRSYP